MARKDFRQGPSWPFRSDTIMSGEEDGSPGDQPGAPPSRVNLAPRKSHSIYAWFIGLPCGILLLAMALAVVVSAVVYAYWNYRARVELDEIKAAAAAEEKRQQEEVRHQKEEAQAREAAEREAKDRQYREELQAKERQHEKELEAQERQRQKEIEAEVLKEQEKTRQAEQERLRQAEERKQEEARKREEQRLAAIERDHEVILRFVKKSVTENKLEDLLWSAPSKAHTAKQQGRLYHLECNYRLFGKGKVGIVYQFFMVDDAVVDWQRGDELKICALDG
jgi:hypothetical protein